MRTDTRSAVWKRIETWLAFVTLQLLLPLAPLGVERLATHRITAFSSTIVAATYGVTISINSRTPFLITAGIVISMAFCFQYGELLHGGVGFEDPGWSAMCAIWFICIYHALERFIIHVKNKEPWEFFGNGADRPPQQQ